jgi:hypothetical protein
MKKIPQETISNIVENKKKLDLTRTECNQIKANLDQKSADVMKLRKKWMSGVRSMVANVDEKFRLVKVFCRSANLLWYRVGTPE